MSAAAAAVPRVKLNTGASVPILGLGTWLSQEGAGTRAAKDAIDIGYRHFDCALLYANEEEIGAGINAKIAEGVVKREDVFVVDKLWNTCHRPDLVVPTLKKTLANLKMDYLDLYLIHWPMAYKEGDEPFPKDEAGRAIAAPYDFLDTWRAMEECVKLGLTKAIGVSNFNKKQMEKIIASGATVPAMNQVESHPYLAQNKLIEFCASKGIAVTAYSPLGSPGGNWKGNDVPALLENPKVLEIAAKHKKTAGQILIRFQVQRGVICIPKSTNKARIQANFEIFDFNLTPEDMKTLDGLDCNVRYVAIPGDVTHPDYPFNDEF